MFFLDFPDRTVSYKTFVHDVAAAIVRMLAESDNDATYISQRKAYSMFGRANVDRWRKQGRVIPLKRPGKVEYRTADLRKLQRVKTDYTKV